MVTLKAIRNFSVRGRSVADGELVEVEADVARVLVQVLAAVVVEGELPPLPPPRRRGRKWHPPSTWPSELRRLGLGEQLALANLRGGPWAGRWR